jgi:hypothetical protein
VTGIQSQLWAGPPREAITFYQAAFGATVVHQTGQAQDIAAQLAIGDAQFWVANTAPKAPRRDLAGRGRTRLAARPHHRPIRAPLGDRHTHRAVATPINTARRHQSRAEREFRPHARPEVGHAQQLNRSTASTRVPADLDA